MLCSLLTPPVLSVDSVCGQSSLIWQKGLMKNLSTPQKCSAHSLEHEAIRNFCATHISEVMGSQSLTFHFGRLLSEASTERVGGSEDKAEQKGPKRMRGERV